MKILKIEWKNFSSYGNKKQSLSFTEANGLFQIIGENGAGKSSISQVITFGLYGKIEGKKLSDKHIEKLEKSHSKYNWKVISPDKNIFVIKNLTKFCKENNLAPSPLYNYGKYKGWTVEKVAQGT